MVFLIIITILIQVTHFHVLESAAVLFRFPHDFCLNRLQGSHSSEIPQTFVCGEKITSPKLVDIFSRSGLYHLVVVSKSHLSFLFLFFMGIFARLLNPSLARSLSFILVGTYFAFCGPQAPILRPLLALMLAEASERYRLGWSSLFRLMISTLICLALQPEWFSSLSLLHSSGCALAFLVAAELSQSALRTAGVAYLFTLPFLWGWANVHPLTLLFNLLLSPILFLMWFFLSWWQFVYPMNWCEQVIDESLRLLSLLLDPVPSVGPPSHLSPILLWLYFWTVCLALWTVQQNVRRRPLAGSGQAL